MIPTIVVTVKNRLEHSLKTFPFNVSQIGTDYNLLYVDYDSEDGFSESLRKIIKSHQDIFSINLRKITLVRLNRNEKYDIRRAKNLGALFACEESSIILINDADTMLGMDYLTKWCNLTKKGKTFATNRYQDTRGTFPARVSPEINYGNIVVCTQDFIDVSGYDETSTGWGGDDDDLFHRLKLKGLREINPNNALDARQYSIMHSDEFRFKDTLHPDMIKPDTEGVKETQRNVYKNKERIKSLKSNYFSMEYVENFTSKEVLYER
jgi:predicted glycosyltransferase involved in capsule biosynthesis